MDNVEINTAYIHIYFASKKIYICLKYISKIDGHNIHKFSLLHLKNFLKLKFHE